MTSSKYDSVPEDEYELPLTAHDLSRTSSSFSGGKPESNSYADGSHGRGEKRSTGGSSAGSSSGGHGHSQGGSSRSGGLHQRSSSTARELFERVHATLAQTFRTRLSRALAIIAAVALLLLWVSSRPSARSHIKDKIKGAAKGWGFSVKEDEHIVLAKKPEYNDSFNPDDLTFTDEQCDAYFPGLWKDIERSVAYYTKHPYTKEYLEASCDDGDWTHARVIIYNNRLYVKRWTPSKFTFTRPQAALALLHQSLVTAREPLPNVEFCMGFDDWGARGKFGLDRGVKDEEVWLMPDYGFFSWPEHVGSYVDFRSKVDAIERATPWEQKTPKLFWRGSMKVGTADRESLVQAAAGHPWNDVKELDWSHPTTAVAMEDHCKWKFQGFPEGNTYSGRLRYLQNCKTVIVTHPPRWIQHWTHLYNADWNSPDQNIVYVPQALGNANGVTVHDEGGKEFLDRTWERLPEVMNELLNDDERAHRIAENQWNFFRNRYISPASAACYWRKVIKGFGSVQKYSVDLSGKETSYESFLLKGIRQPDGGGHHRRSTNSSETDADASRAAAGPQLARRDLAAAAAAGAEAPRPQRRDSRLLP